MMTNSNSKPKATIKKEYINTELHGSYVSSYKYVKPKQAPKYNNIYVRNINIFPINTIVKNPSNKRGCAFLEFNTKEQAEFILKNFNGKILNNFELKFNKVKTFEEKYSDPKITKFTVSIYFLIIIFIL